MAPKTQDFESKLSDLLRDAESRGWKFVDVSSGNLHQAVGGYPPAKGENHAMRACCDAMRNVKKTEDEVLHTPPSGTSTKLIIRYRLPR